MKIEDPYYPQQKCSPGILLLVSVHTRFSHSYLLNREDQAQCTYCDCALTVVHMLLEYPHYSIVRQRYFSVTTLKDLLETVNTHTILDFIKEIGFYNRI